MIKNFKSEKEITPSTIATYIVCQMSKYVLFSIVVDNIFVFLQNGGKNISMK